MILRIMLLAAISVPAAAATRADPRGILPSVRPAVVQRGAAAQTGACGDVPARPLSLADLVDVALCRNPQTAASWASVRGAAAQVGVAQSANLPTLDASIGPQINRNDSFRSGGGFVGPNGIVIGGGGGGVTSFDSAARLALNYLLFDGGGRAARIDGTRAQQRAALAQYADAAQGVVLSVVTAYNSLEANRAVEVANLANTAFARQSRDLAAARARAGVATGADRLQAETSLSQAELTLIQTRGNVATARAQLAVAAGLPPTLALDLAPAAALATGALLRSGADALIADAERLRPDIIAARANIDVAAANLRAQRSAGRPSVAVSAGSTLSATDTQLNNNIGSVGLTLSLPLFSGWNTRYNIAAARAESDRQAAVAEQVRQQAGLEVYTNYIALQTALGSLGTARALIASATASADIAQGRYRAGVGLFADLLNAQSALASARTQLVQSEFNVRSANAQLARAVGAIGEAIDAER